MAKVGHKILLGLSWIIGFLALVVVLYFSFMMVTDFRPVETINLETKKNAVQILEKGVPFSVLTFNIGYCGMDAGADFFMDGGGRSRCKSLEQTQTNLKNITSFLAGAKADLLILQEVDVKSSRSYRVNELDYLQKNLVGYGAIFAVNYKVPWVPVPLTRPMGTVMSGLLTLTGYQVRSALRLRLPGQEPWPRQLAELDRCLLACRLPVAGGKELVLFNLHLSVFDQRGRIRKLQLAYLKKQLLAEYGNGNYVIAGGDWNHGLPDSDPGLFKATRARPKWYMPLPEDFTPPGFSWAIDKTLPTVRSSASTYKKGENFVAIIDGFLVSANIEILKVTGHDLAFSNSDHNPVTAVFVLK